MERGRKVLWVLLFLVSGTLYYILFGTGEITGNIAKSGFIQEEVFVLRVIDGDTVELNDSRKVRMLGTNTPEKKRFMSDEAVAFTKQMENQKAVLEYKEKDKYGRVLGYLFFQGESMNEGLIRNGLAHIYYYDKDFYYENLVNAELEAREKGIGIWQESKNFGCLELIKLQYEEPSGRCKNGEELILENRCSTLNVLIKDDATHEFPEKIPQGRFTMNFSCVFNDAGDSLFIWDDSGLLVFYRY